MSILDTILLVDDDKINNFINQRLIKKLKVAQHVMVTTNGEEGLNYIKENCRTGRKCPDLILLDINMPVMDGFDFIRYFEEMDYQNKEKTKIIILTTSKNTKDLETIKALGDFGFINKPLTEEKLFNCLTHTTS
ncbi:MAG: response regulator [Cytophagaceae bacterium]